MSRSVQFSNRTHSNASEKSFDNPVNVKIQWNSHQVKSYAGRAQSNAITGLYGEVTVVDHRHTQEVAPVNLEVMCDRHHRDCKTQLKAIAREANLGVMRMSGFMLKTIQRYRSRVRNTEVMKAVHCPSTQRDPTLGQRLAEELDKSLR
ncbi:hypothetical protein ACROYT_G002330 [Oculina patagonica]